MYLLEQKHELRMLRGKVCASEQASRLQNVIGITLGQVWVEAEGLWRLVGMSVMVGGCRKQEMS